MKKTTVGDCKRVTLAKHPNERGNLTVVGGAGDVPFDIKRIYYIYDVPAAEERGGHAHHKLEQMIVAASGSFDVILDDGQRQKTITLNRPFEAIIMPKGIWRVLNNFSAGAICLVLASDHYDESDYIRDYDQFLKIKGHE